MTLNKKKISKMVQQIVKILSLLLVQATAGNNCTLFGFVGGGLMKEVF